MVVLVDMVAVVDKVVVVVMVVRVVIALWSWTGWKGKTGQTEQTGQTKLTCLTYELNFPGNLWMAAFAILVMFYFTQWRFGELEQNPNIFPKIPFDGSCLARQNHNWLKLNHLQLSADDSETPVIKHSFVRVRTLRLWPSPRPIWKFRQSDKILTSNTSLCSSLSLETINHS